MIPTACFNHICSHFDCYRRESIVALHSLLQIENAGTWARSLPIKVTQRAPKEEFQMGWRYLQQFLLCKHNIFKPLGSISRLKSITLLFSLWYSLWPTITRSTGSLSIAFTPLHKNTFIYLKYLNGVQYQNLFYPIYIERASVYRMMVFHLMCLLSTNARKIFLMISLKKRLEVRNVSIRNVVFISSEYLHPFFVLIQLPYFVHWTDPAIFSFLH
jgi:hypothetical protein